MTPSEQFQICSGAKMKNATSWKKAEQSSQRAQLFKCAIAKKIGKKGDIGSSFL